MVVPRWIERVLAELQRSNVAELRVFILNAGQSMRDRACFDATRSLSPVSLQCYERIDRRLVAGERDPLERVDLRLGYPGIPVLPVAPTKERMEADDIERVRAHDLDVILRFGFAVVRGAICAAARYGVWSYQPGDVNEHHGAPPLFWEIYEASRFPR